MQRNGGHAKRVIYTNPAALKARQSERYLQGYRSAPHARLPALYVILPTPIPDQGRVPTGLSNLDLVSDRRCCRLSACDPFIPI